jgi:hypothetical protein
MSSLLSSIVWNSKIYVAPMTQFYENLATCRRFGIGLDCSAPELSPEFDLKANASGEWTTALQIDGWKLNNT